MKNPIKFNLHNITNGIEKTKVWYSLDNACYGVPCVKIYAKDYSGNLSAFFSNVKNNTETMTDYFETDSIILFKGDKHYMEARKTAEKHEVKRYERYNKIENNLKLNKRSGY